MHADFTIGPRIGKGLETGSSENYWGLELLFSDDKDLLGPLDRRLSCQLQDTERNRKFVFLDIFLYIYQ